MNMTETETDTQPENEFFKARLKIRALFAEYEAVVKKINGELFGEEGHHSYYPSDIDCLIERMEMGVWERVGYDEFNQIEKPTEQSKRDAKELRRLRTMWSNRHQEGEPKFPFVDCCPECGGHTAGDGETEGDGCAEDWTVFSHWSAWCVGHGFRDDGPECDCDHEAKLEAYRENEKKPDSEREFMHYPEHEGCSKHRGCGWSDSGSDALYSGGSFYRGSNI